MSATYHETFDTDRGGWWGIISNSGGPLQLEHAKSCVIARSPWWIDYNHAPPGAGYLHLLFCTFTAGTGGGEHFVEVGGPPRFVDQNMPTNFTNARVTVNCSGELRVRGAQMLMLVQGSVGGVVTGWLLTGQPIAVSETLQQQTIMLTPDEAQWTCLGSRHDRTRSYGRAPLREILSNVNVDIMFVLFPLNVQPMGPIAGDPHTLRAGRDYPVWRSDLPEGYVKMDEVKIEFA